MPRAQRSCMANSATRRHPTVCIRLVSSSTSVRGRGWRGLEVRLPNKQASCARWALPADGTGEPTPAVCASDHESPSPSRSTVSGGGSGQLSGNSSADAQGTATSTSSDTHSTQDLSSVRPDPDPAERPRLRDDGALTQWNERLEDLRSIEQLQGSPGPSRPHRNEQVVSSDWQALRDGVLSGGIDSEGISDDEDDEVFEDDTEHDEPPSEEEYSEAESTPVPREDFTTMFEEFEALLQQAQQAPLEVAQIEKMFPYPLDGFQREALEKSVQGSSVVVCAPTGAGKTAIAVAAAVPMLAAGKRVIYTTPLKALSNQKLFELQEIFGEEKVGLRTGDVSVNAGAPVMIMTTEILRNISYRALLEGDPLSGFSPNLSDVALTVLDEVHYLGHPDRGSVWEEIIINCPRHMQLLAMSATVANPNEIGEWIEHVHGRCETVQTSFRPVPLKWWFAWGQPKDGDQDSGNGAGRRWSRGHREAAGAKVSLAELMEKRRGRRRAMQLNMLLDRSSRSAKRLRGQAASARRKMLQGSNRKVGYDQLQVLQQKLATLEQEQRAAPVEPDTQKLIAALQEAEYLPAIYFVFSRKRCNEYAASVSTEAFVTAEERQLILGQLNELRTSQPDAIPKELEEPLLRGIASHHAGLLPGWKALVEALFQQGLIKVVFATETLAAGINMPARTTVISSISRRRNGEYAPLPHNDLLQMAGRAGRRGYDTQGHCVISQTRFEGARAAFSIIARGPEQIASQFSISYGMVLNLLSTRTLDDCALFLNRSFLRFQAVGSVEETLAEAQRLESEAEVLLRRAEGSSGEEKLFKNFEAANAVAVSHRQALRVARRQALAVRYDAATKAMQLPVSQTAMESFQDALTDAQPSGGGSSTWWAGHSSQGPAAEGGAAKAPAAGDGGPCSSSDETSQNARSRMWEEAESMSSVGAPASLVGGQSGSQAGQAGQAAAGGQATDTCVLVTMDVSEQGLIETDLLTGVCLGQISLVARHFDYPPGPNEQRNRRLYSQDELLACLGSDNRLYLLRPSYIAAVHHKAPLAEYLTAGSTTSHADALLLIKQALQEAAVVRWSGSDLGMVAPGSAATARFAFNFSKHAPDSAEFLLADSGWPEAVMKAKQEYKMAKRDLKGIEREVRRVRQRLDARGGESGPAGKSMAMKSRARQLRKKARGLQNSAEWTDVVSTVEILEKFGALTQTEEGEQGWYDLQNLGLIGRDIRFENELWLAMILESSALEGIKPSTLAGLLCALVTPFQVSRQEVLVTLEPSVDLQLLVEELSQDAVHLASTQAQRGIMCPIEIDLKMAGIVEAWTWKVDWNSLKESCDLDDGDTARLLCRVADLLRQVAAASAVKERLRTTARSAYKRIYRQPICDLLGV